MKTSCCLMWTGIALAGLAPGELRAQSPPPRASAGDAGLTGGPLVQASIDEFASSLDGARESFLNVDAREAALRIRQAVATMQNRTKNAAEAAKEVINRSTAELNSLAKAIEERRVASVRPLDEAFARANHALAQNHLLLAMRAQSQQARQRVGEELNSAIGHFEQARQRLGEGLRKDEQELVHSTRRLASNLIHGVEVTSDELGQGIRSLGRRLESVEASDASARPKSNAVAPFELEVTP